MSALKFWSGLVLLAAAVGVLCLSASRWRARTAERRQRPSALREAELVFVEKPFRSRGRWPIVARVDRVYRLPSGLLMLVELKTRSSLKVTLSDVIQLSAQRVAMMDALGEVVASEAFALAPGRTERQPLQARAVRLLPRKTVLEIAARRSRLLAGHDVPQPATEDRSCHTCGFQGRCRSASWTASEAAQTRVRRDRD